MAEKKVPRVTVGVVILNFKNEVLVVESHKYPDLFTIPAGHVKFGETLEEAVVREVKEETNLEAKDVKFIRWSEAINNTDYYDKNLHFISFNYSCKVIDTNVKLNNESQSYQWLTIKKALELNLDSFTKGSLEEVKMCLSKD